MSRRRIVLLGLAFGAAAWVGLGLREGRPGARGGREPRVEQEDLQGTRAAPGPVAVAVAVDPSPQGAAALRRRLRLEEATRREVEAELLAPETPRDRRMLLALVLGTLPGDAQDAVLLQVLERYGGDAEVARCVLLALGALREPPDDDEVFDLGDRPWGVHGPFGVGITVLREIGDPAVRAAVARWLENAEGRLREAAATALRHSIQAADVRTAFLSALAVEPSDEAALVLGEALAEWAGGASPGAEVTDVVTRLLARAASPGLDGYRFRMENDFRRIELDDAQRATLREYAHPARPWEVRSFALAALAASAERHDTTGDVRDLLEQVLAGDRDPAARDLAARLLGPLRPGPATVDRLAAAAASDPAWHVRYQALGSLAQLGDGPAIVEALRDATADKDERVARRARELLGPR